MNTGWIKLICTIGPSSSNPYVLRRMKQLGVSLLRINMSHTSIEQLDKAVKSIRAATDIPICIDTEGAQIRTGKVVNNNLELKQGAIIELTKKNIIGDSQILTLTPDSIFNQIKIGTMLFLDFNKVTILIVDTTETGSFLAKVMQTGRIGSNKAVNIDKDIDLPSITKKDLKAIQYANKNNINIFALSFSKGKEAIKRLRSLAKRNATIISKVESCKGINNINDIIQYSDAILIDRGDLSREKPVEKIPALQKMIITKAHQKPIPVYVATNLLESMVTNPFPSRAEINDIANTLADGANGLVLAAETAIGKYPVQCVNMVGKMIKQYNSEIAEIAKLGISWKGIDLINNTRLPHGYSSDDYRISLKTFKKKKKTDASKDEKKSGNEQNKKTEQAEADINRGVANGAFAGNAVGKYDFVAGEKTLYFDDFSRVEIGDFPADINTNASGEIVTINGKEGKWLNLTKNGNFLFDAIKTLPENFTLEFNAGIQNDPSNNYSGLGLIFSTVKEDLLKQNFFSAGTSALFLHPGAAEASVSVISSNTNGVSFDNQIKMPQWDVADNRFVKVSIWRQKGRLRVYANEDKLVDIPRFFTENDGQYQMSICRNFFNECSVFINNIKYSIAAPDTRSKLLTEGKFSTTEILFDTNSDKIKPESDGNPAANQTLSVKRAEAVKMRFVYGFGIDETRIITDGKGSSEALNTNKTPEEKAANRRVEFIKL